LPEPDATVKANRTVFLTINRATAPDIFMPKLEGLSLSYALDKLERMHLKLGDTIYRPDFMKGSILEQQYNSSRIAAGTKVPWGSRINLVIGAGLQLQQLPVPEVVGLTFADAKSLLESKGIGLAAIVAMSTVRDTASAFVYKQNPERFDADSKQVFMQPGQTMDIWLSPVRLDVDSIKVKNEQEQLP
jgi:beta-lactam-binding protein with PASTA domain